jgi:hypothetical protein
MVMNFGDWWETLPWWRTVFLLLGAARLCYPLLLFAVIAVTGSWEALRGRPKYRIRDLRKK